MIAVLDCSVPGSRDVILTREAEEAPRQAVFMAAPERHREFEPSVPSIAKSDQRPGPGATA